MKKSRTTRRSGKGKSSSSSLPAPNQSSQKRSRNSEQNAPITRAKRQFRRREEDTSRNLTADDIPTIVSSIFQTLTANAPSNAIESSTNNANEPSTSNHNESGTSNASTPRNSDAISSSTNASRMTSNANAPRTNDAHILKLEVTGANFKKYTNQQACMGKPTLSYSGMFLANLIILLIML